MIYKNVFNHYFWLPLPQTCEMFATAHIFKIISWSKPKVRVKLTRNSTWGLAAAIGYSDRGYLHYVQIAMNAIYTKCK